MRILLDTNVLLRISDKSHMLHGEALQSLEWLEAHGHDIVIVPQVLYEYWVVATRPRENNGLGMSAAVAHLAITRWMSVLRFLLDERGIFHEWQQLVTVYQVQGKTAHDARLVAAMLRHGVPFLLTFNTADFVRYPMIRAFTPGDILNGKFPG